MNLTKLFVVAIVLFTRAYSIVGVEKFDAEVTGKPNIKELCLKNEQGIETAFAVCAFSYDYKFHMQDVRGSNRPKIAETNNMRYRDTVYNVIPTEIARALFKIRTKGMNKHESGIITLSGSQFKKLGDYDASNWNYLLFMNVLNHAFKNPANEWENDKLIDAVADSMRKNIDKAYDGMIQKAKADIKVYFNNLKLYAYIRQLNSAIHEPTYSPSEKNTALRVAYNLPNVDSGQGDLVNDNIGSCCAILRFMASPQLKHCRAAPSLRMAIIEGFSPNDSVKPISAELGLKYIVVREEKVRIIKALSVEEEHVDRVEKPFNMPCDIRRDAIIELQKGMDESHRNVLEELEKAIKIDDSDDEDLDKLKKQHRDKFKEYEERLHEGARKSLKRIYELYFDVDWAEGIYAKIDDDMRNSLVEAIDEYTNSLKGE